MSIAANVAATFVALVPAQAGDQVVASSLQFDRLTAVAEATAREAGRLLPRRLPGVGPWTCRREGGRNVTCAVTTSTHAVGISIRYRVRGRVSTTRVASWILEAARR